MFVQCVALLALFWRAHRSFDAYHVHISPVFATHASCAGLNLRCANLTLKPRFTNIILALAAMPPILVFGICVTSEDRTNQPGAGVPQTHTLTHSPYLRQLKLGKLDIVASEVSRHLRAISTCRRRRIVMPEISHRAHFMGE